MLHIILYTHIRGGNTLRALLVTMHTCGSMFFSSLFLKFYLFSSSTTSSSSPFPTPNSSLFVYSSFIPPSSFALPTRTNIQRVYLYIALKYRYTPIEIASMFKSRIHDRISLCLHSLRGRKKNAQSVFSTNRFFRLE